MNKQLVQFVVGAATVSLLSAWVQSNDKKQKRNAKKKEEETEHTIHSLKRDLADMSFLLAVTAEERDALKEATGEISEGEVFRVDNGKIQNISAAENARIERLTNDLAEAYELIEDLREERDSIRSDYMIENEELRSQIEALIEKPKPTRKSTPRKKVVEVAPEASDAEVISEKNNAAEDVEND